jgi:hypothetical protein
LIFVEKNLPQKRREKYQKGPLVDVLEELGVLCYLS